MTIHNGTFKSTNKDLNRNLNHSSEYDYVTLFKSTFDRKLFPNSFDTWTVQEQCTWIDENIAKFYPNVPQSLLSFVSAVFRQIDFDRSLEKKPEWLDMEKYHRGQKFVRDNYFAIMFSILISMMQTYTFNDALKPLIISRGSTTPYRAFKRYLSTLQRVSSWYTGEPWVKGTSAYNHMQIAHKMHFMMKVKLRKLDNEQIDNESKIMHPWCPDHEILRKDFAAACPFEKFGQRPYVTYSKSYKPKGINNGDMAGIQSGFMGLVLLNPQYIGIHNATDEDIEAFCHMWRCYGYCLGMKDEYNLCRGSLKEIKQRVQDFYEYWVIPNFKDITPEWEHMTRCMIETVNYLPWIHVSYRMIVLITTDILNLNMPHLYASLSYSEWIAYKAWTFIIRYGLKLSILRTVFNKMLLEMFDKASNYSLEKEAELQKTSKKQLPKFSVM